MNIIRIKLSNGAITQPFLRFTYKQVASHQLNQITVIRTLVDHTPSLIGVSDQQNLILKLVKPRRTLEIAKLLTGRSRLSKEVRGALLLKQHGFNTPTIHEVGYGLIPQKPFSFLGYYLMDNLDELGYIEVFKLYQQVSLDAELRKISFENILKGLDYLKNHHIGLFDFTLGNVFTNDEGEVMWIDTGISKYPSATKRFQQKYNHSINRFLRIHQDLLTAQEHEQAQSLLFKC